MSTGPYSVSEVLQDGDGHVAATVRRPARPEEIVWTEVRYELLRPEIRDLMHFTVAIDMRQLAAADGDRIVSHIRGQLRADHALWIGTKWRRVSIRLDHVSVTFSMTALDLTGPAVPGEHSDES
jgi:hypothetical protein